MGDYVTLLGAEDVRQASRNMAGAAEEMKQAAMMIDNTLTRFTERMEDWVRRLEDVAEEIGKTSQEGRA